MRTVERLKAAQTERRGAPPRLFTMLLLLLVLLLAGFLFINSSFFSVGSVVVEGNKYIAAEDVYRIAGIPEQVNIFRLNTSDIKNRLQHDLRVSQADVIRKFPASIVISIKERQPLAFVASGYGFVQLDRQGVVLAAQKNIKQVNVPMITGIRLGNIYVGDQVDVEIVKNVLAYLAALDETTLNQLSEVNIKSPDEMVAYTTNSIQIRLGNQERLLDKARLTAEILQEVSDKKMTVEYIDVNYASPFIKFKK